MNTSVERQRLAVGQQYRSGEQRFALGHPRAEDLGGGLKASFQLESGFDSEHRRRLRLDFNSPGMTFGARVK